ncbi:ComEC/Rec2 family competence protein [Novosphingobium anseongense]|uniref:ComEC/Rec2 family competence protein n=1 Tax=Novosphingobium anseongense TaxID=3133436 RepID=UPI003A8EF91E
MLESAAVSDETAPESKGDLARGAALQHRPWRSRSGLSSVPDAVERFLGTAGFERGPWLAVAFAAGIALWFLLANAWQWLALLATCGALTMASLAGFARDGRFPYLRLAMIALALLIAAGCAVVWSKSELVGARPIERPLVTELSALVLDREPRPAEDRVRLLLATREPETGRAIRVRVSLPLAEDRQDLSSGARIRLRARLMPPAPPMLPGAYDFARTAWFSGIAATGSVLGTVTVIERGSGGGWLERAQARLSAHVRSRLDGSAGAIATAFASGDRGAISKADDEAMRDAGLSHLLSISGLHVSAVVAAVYLIALRLFALWPWLALRVRLPLFAAGAGAGAGIFYTLLTGAEVPTVRSCIGAVLVLVALALGREPLSMRMVAVAAFFVLLFWPEAVVGPSFQMSFVAVIAIVALHGAAPVRAFLAPREEGWYTRLARNLAMLLVTGVVIELAIMPLGLFHFHRAGVYGALANVVAIPLTTVVTMPLIFLALVLDLAGLGAPAWWLTGQSIDVMLALAHWVAAQPGAVTTMPAMGRGAIALFVAGGLWLALWRGHLRLWGLAPVLVATVSLAFLRPPDILVSGDGRHVGITGVDGGGLLVLREQKSEFVRDNLTELSGMDGELRLLEQWPGARCNRDFCAVTLPRAGREWHLLIGRGRDRVAERQLVAACDRVDIVISDRWLPRSCRPAWLKADRRTLERTGGLAIDLAERRVTTVVETQGEHGWWRKPEDRPWVRPASGRGETQAAKALPAILVAPENVGTQPSSRPETEGASRRP